MKIAFIHYHLKTGGVSTVLRQQIEAIHDRCETLVLSGEPLDQTYPTDVIHIPALAYSDRTDENIEPYDVSEMLCRAIHSKWHQGCDLIHVHNPTLAKNIHFLNILKALQIKKNKSCFYKSTILRKMADLRSISRMHIRQTGTMVSLTRGTIIFL